MAHILYGIATWPGSGLKKMVSGLFLGAGLALFILSAGSGGPAVPCRLTMRLSVVIQARFRVVPGIRLWPQKGAKSYV